MSESGGRGSHSGARRGRRTPRGACTDRADASPLRCCRLLPDGGTVTHGPSSLFVATYSFTATDLDTRADRANDTALRAHVLDVRTDGVGRHRHTRLHAGLAVELLGPHAPGVHVEAWGQGNQLAAVGRVPLRARVVAPRSGAPRSPHRNLSADCVWRPYRRRARQAMRFECAICEAQPLTGGRGAADGPA